QTEIETVRDIKVRIAVVQPGIKGIYIAQLIPAGKTPFTKSGGEIVEGVRKSIVRPDAQPFAEKIRHLVLDVEGVVETEAVVTSEVYITVLVVEAIRTVSVAQEFAAAAATVRVAASASIHIGNVIKVHATRARIGNRNDTLLPHAAVDGQIPSLGICGFHVLVDRTETNCRQKFGSRACQRTKIVGVDRLVDRDILIGNKADHSIIRWVLNGVKGHVSKVAFVTYPITSAERGFAVAHDVPCK